MTQAGTTIVEEQKAFDDNVVRIYRCAKVVKGGRRFSFSALVVVGDRHGRVGIGYGKAREVPAAVEKGKQVAIRNLTRVKIKGSTIPHRVTARYGTSRVILIPACEGTGVIAGASAQAVLALAGVRNVLTKSYGSRSPKNLVGATFAALTSLHSADEIEKLRGVKLAG